MKEKLKIGSFVKFRDTHKLKDDYLYRCGIRKGDYARVRDYSLFGYDYCLDKITGDWGELDSVTVYASEIMPIDSDDEDKVLPYLI